MRGQRFHTNIFDKIIDFISNRHMVTCQTQFMNLNYTILNVPGNYARYDVSVSEEKEISEEPKLMMVTKDSVVQTKMKQILTSSTVMRVLKEEEEVLDPKKNVSKLIAVTDSLEILKRKNSKTSNKNMLNGFPESKPSNSGDITFQETPSNIEDNNSQPPSEAPRRISIGFTGKSLIYSDQNEKDIKQQKLKPKPREKRKKTQPNKFITRQIKKKNRADRNTYNI
ncbi:hypothetical protein WA026_014292 [Henosepilachna vigintioctopunctata]|uniref:Uncharacterized protein n=1 Tax=Henosepilachna vigintioctopunctata TaxID=420089 RepID=A0AAW1TVJ1_9CUCU